MRSVIKKAFYERDNVVSISRELLGKVLCTNIGDEVCKAFITETEAYEGVIDKASHAYNNRRTKRTEIMFGEPGVAYVYLCYGIHHLFNIVTNATDVPHAVLIRAIQPIENVEAMMKRRNLATIKEKSFIGPGTVTQALGIKTADTGTDLTVPEKIWLEDWGIKVKPSEIITGPRVGIDYAEDHAAWPYRFLIKKIDYK